MSKQDTINHFKHLIEKYENIVVKLKDALNALNEEESDSNEKVNTRATKKTVSKGTLVDIVLEIIDKLNRPVTAVELLNKYNADTNQELIRKDFSSRLSMASKKKDIKSITLNGANGEKLYFWVRKSWIDNNGELKKEYRNKIV